MNDKLIAQLEEQLEYLVEGAFTNLFRKRLNTHDIALKLVRSMENGLRHDTADLTRPVAPDRYTILLHPESQQSLEKNRPDLAAALADQLVELAGEAGYRLSLKPVVTIVADPGLGRWEVTVLASHASKEENQTQAMKSIPVQKIQQPVPQCQLIINGEKSIYLKESIINVGRSDDNHIILDDPFISRHHIQIRWRFGVYTLFDVKSRAGTRVNNVPVSEHRLQAGDVIQLGNSTIVFMNLADNNNAPGTTQTLNPVDE